MRSVRAKSSVVAKPSEVEDDAHFEQKTSDDGEGINPQGKRVWKCRLSEEERKALVEEGRRIFMRPVRAKLSVVAKPSEVEDDAHFEQFKSGDEENDQMCKEPPRGPVVEVVAEEKDAK